MESYTQQLGAFPLPVHATAYQQYRLSLLWPNYNNIIPYDIYRFGAPIQPRPNINTFYNFESCGINLLPTKMSGSFYHSM
jgi:hypothetical protein